ncbi:hypothetical protein BC831DRAFT_488167, partial [Entophlyctis helioformis]
MRAVTAGQIPLPLGSLCVVGRLLGAQPLLLVTLRIGTPLLLSLGGSLCAVCGREAEHGNDLGREVDLHMAVIVVVLLLVLLVLAVCAVPVGVAAVASLGADRASSSRRCRPSQLLVVVCDGSLASEAVVCPLGPLWLLLL